MRKIVDYIILQDVNLEKVVNDHIKCGWEPIGGLNSCKLSDGTYIFSQTMVTYKEVKDSNEVEAVTWQTWNP